MISQDLSYFFTLSLLRPSPIPKTFIGSCLPLMFSTLILQILKLPSHISFDLFQLSFSPESDPTISTKLAILNSK